MTRSNFLVWTGLRQSIPLKLRVNIPNFKVILDLESLKCHDYYCFLMKQKLEKPCKWVKPKNEFSLDNKQVSKAFLLPVKVANEPYLRSFQYKVLNSILFTNDSRCKIGYVYNPKCTFCHQLTETISHMLSGGSFSNSIWHAVNENILSKNQGLQRNIAMLLLGLLTRRWKYLIT